MAELTPSENNKFASLGKSLAHTEKEVRDKAVETIRSEIASLKESTELEMMKLWKGLFYAFWMSDKPPVQEELAIALSKMMVEFRTLKLTMSYIKCFWDTMVREWRGIDRYRLDKYCLLIRKMMDQTFLLLNSRKWEPSLVEEYKQIVLHSIMHPDYYGPMAQYCESFLEELNATLPHISSFDFLSLLKPIVEIFVESKQSVLVNCIVNRVFISLISDYNCFTEKEPAEGLPAFDKVDLRYVHSIFFDYVFGTEKVANNKRKYFSDLELKYEEKVKSCYNSMDAPELKAPSREEESAPAIKEQKEKTPKKKAAARRTKNKKK